MVYRLYFPSTYTVLICIFTNAVFLMIVKCVMMVNIYMILTGQDQPGSGLDERTKGISLNKDWGWTLFPLPLVHGFVQLLHKCTVTVWMIFRKMPFYDYMENRSTCKYHGHLLIMDIDDRFLVQGKGERTKQIWGSDTGRCLIWYTLCIAAIPI